MNFDLSHQVFSMPNDGPPKKKLRYLSNPLANQTLKLKSALTLDESTVNIKLIKLISKVEKLISLIFQLISW
jgi:hypothetical protein